MTGGEEKKNIYRTIVKATGLFGGTQVFTILCSIIKTKLVAIWLGAEGALVDDVVVFFLDLHKRLGIGTRRAVGTQAQLLLVRRTVERAADEPEIRRVVIDVADGRFREPVGHHPRRKHLGKRVVLLLRDQIFLFISLECTLIFTYGERLLRIG